MPGLGNPLTDLDVVDFNRYAERCGALLKIAANRFTARDAMLMEEGVY